MKKAGTLAAGIVLTILLIKFDYASFWTAICRIPAIAFFGLLALQVVSQLLINFQWCRIGKVMGKPCGFMKMLYVNARGTIMECITPGVKVGGEVLRAVLLKKELGYSAPEAATLVAIQKMMSLISFFIINLLSLVHISDKVYFLNGIWAKAMVYSFLILSTLIFIGVFFFGGLVKGRLSAFTPKRKWAVSLTSFFNTLLVHVETLKAVRWELPKQLLLSFLIWILFPLKMVILVSLFTSNYDMVYLTEVTFISYMVGMIPLLPGGLGSFEAVMSGLLMLMRLSLVEAAAITVLFRFNTFWFVIILSLVLVGIMEFGGKKHEQKNLKKAA